MLSAKWFHISDILTITTGRALVIKEEMTMPDGIKREAYEYNMNGIISIVEHVSGKDLINEIGQMDANSLKEYAPHVEESLIQQLPGIETFDPSEELKNLEKELEEAGLPNDEINRQLANYCNKWVQKVADEYGGEWHQIQPDPIPDFDNCFEQTGNTPLPN